MHVESLCLGRPRNTIVITIVILTSFVIVTELVTELPFKKITHKNILIKHKILQKFPDR